MGASYTTGELMACLVARRMAHAKVGFVGAAQPALRGGMLLGHLMHNHDMRMLISMTTTNLVDVGEIGRFSFMTDWRTSRWAEHYRVVEEIFTGMRRVSHWEPFFVGALQIDPYGNSNLIGIKNPDGSLKLRGAGAVGTPSITAVSKSFSLVATRHTPLTFVQECDFVSCPGWVDGSEGARDRLGLLGGPKECLTPLAVLDFGPDRRFRINSVHPGVSVDEVRERTGFDLGGSDDVPVTEPPTDEELEVLRRRVDVHGVLREEKASDA